MGDHDNEFSGGCMCGAVKFIARGNPSGIYHCHCESCRRHTGAPLSTMAVYSADQIQFSGADRGLYDCSPGVQRGFCKTCGSSMTWETDHPRFGLICSLHISSFDEPEAFTPEAHSFYGEKMSWMDVVDTLPRYEGLVEISKLISHGPR